jgi:hypothetical protein
MATPTYNGTNLFNSDDDTGTYCEGVLEALDYGGLFQTMHFQGEDGDRFLAHGWSSRQWVYRGFISAASLADLKVKYNAIEAEIDAAVDHPDSYWKTLTDSFGSSFTKAQVRTFHKLGGGTHKTADGYYCPIIVTGVIQHQDQE